MRERHPDQLQAATQQLVSIRRLDGFRDLAVAFKSHGAQGQLAQWRSMGFDCYVDRATGEVMVSRDGGRPVSARELGGQR